MIGSDLDGAFGREQCPSDVETIADLAKIPGLLRKRGYTEDDVANIAHGNFIRFLRRCLVVVTAARSKITQRYGRSSRSLHSDELPKNPKPRKTTDGLRALSVPSLLRVARQAFGHWQLEDSPK